jgi:hypothetical protein
VNPDNTATLYTGKVETGTGVGTALAQIAAEELDFHAGRRHALQATAERPDRAAGRSPRSARKRRPTRVAGPDLSTPQAGSSSWAHRRACPSVDVPWRPAGDRHSDERRILHVARRPELTPILRAGFTSVSVPGGKWFVEVTL